MFNHSDTPLFYATPLGADFPRALVDGLVTAYAQEPPEALGRLRLVLNTSRMARRVKALFDEQGASFLPRISLISEPEALGAQGLFPPPVSPLQRQLDLVPLIRSLIRKDTSIAPESAVFELASSLAKLIGEMQEQGVHPQDITALDVSDQSGHWQQMQRFLEIIAGYFSAEGGELDTAARQRAVIEHLCQSWGHTAPQDPILIAGSTGSRGLSAQLMRAVASLPNGAVLLPGFDMTFARQVWPDLPEKALGEEHPQYRFKALLDGLGLGPDAVQLWNGTEAPNPQRTDLLSLALRPAPVTDQWLQEAGKAALLLPKALEDVTLLEAPSERMEALAVALRLRQAAHDGTRAAVITPDRTLARRITAALDAWGLTPDESTGEPLHLSPLGRLMREASALLGKEPVTAEVMISLLKHPLCGGPDVPRNTHLLMSREFELYLRRKGIPYPQAAHLEDWALKSKREQAAAWAAWVSEVFSPLGLEGELALSDVTEKHRTLTDQLTSGVDENGASIWLRPDGTQISRILENLASCSADGMSLTDYARLLDAQLTAGEMRRDTAKSHPDILIWGTLEARVQGVDLIILAGLNEGTWPEAPAPDPWLNRQMRARLGLLLPERRIGLSAHDFQQATAAQEVWISRATRSDDAETVASRWVIRLVNLLEGLPDGRGEAALQSMRRRGAEWAARAEAFHEPDHTAEPAKRPAPAPPVQMRPTALSITEVQRLIRDPYAVYARRVLKLNALNPLQKMPDALMRGTVLHKVMEVFVAAALKDSALRTRAHLLQLTEQILDAEVPFPAARLIWRARFERIVDELLAAEETRLADAANMLAEVEGHLDLPDVGITLKGKADRLDILKDGTLAIYDYKTGTISNKNVRRDFDKQLQLTAAMAEEGAFRNVTALSVSRLAFLGLGTKAEEQVLSPEEYEPDRVLAEFRKLILAFQAEDKGYPSRRAVQREDFSGDYDHLARYGEWSTDAEPEVEILK